MCTPKDVLDPSVDGQISYLCGRHDCSLLHFGDPVIGTVYDDRILVSSGQWWPLPRGSPPTSAELIPIYGLLCPRCKEATTPLASGRFSALQSRRTEMRAVTSWTPST